MSDKDEMLTTNRKALTINLDDPKYGTFAEIGAGQEVVRYFFQAGGAAGTVAKSISAYDMKFSDEIYGKATRYVSKERLGTMLDHEFALLQERLAAQRGDRTAFFVYSNTVAAKSFTGNNEQHGWMGLRYQCHPLEPTNDVTLHVRLLDKENLLQQQALGIIGVNLIYGAFYYHNDPRQLIKSLLDNLTIDRIEVDMIQFSGPDFKDADNRLLSLQLVELGLTNAVLFGPGGDVLQPAETLHKKAIVVERGSFRPITRVNMDMLDCAAAQFIQEPLVKGKDVIVLLEITMNNLLASGAIDHADFLARVDTLNAIGCNVLISNYFEYYRLSSYFRRYSKEMVGIAMGINSLIELFNEKYYENLDGGILESFGRLFRNEVKLYVYPMREDVYNRYVNGADLEKSAGSAALSHIMVTANNVRMPSHLQNLYQHLLENHYIDRIVAFDGSLGDIFSRDVLQRIRDKDPTWETLVPPKVAEIIKTRALFGCASSPAS